MLQMDRVVYARCTLPIHGTHHLQFASFLESFALLLCCAAGEIIASHMRAVDFIGAFASIKVRFASAGQFRARPRQGELSLRLRAPMDGQTGRKFKTVVTSAAGYPLDKTYYQSGGSPPGHLSLGLPRRVHSAAC